jgi:CheY-like chemotaxis protein
MGYSQIEEGVAEQGPVGLRSRPAALEMVRHVDSEGMMSLRVLLVDDNQEFLHSAQQVLAAHPELEVVGAATSGAQALEQVVVLLPDLILLDLAMPGINGLEAARRIKATTPAVRIIILTLHDDPYYQSAARAAGADGFVSKAVLGRQLFPVIASLFDTPLADPDPPCLGGSP